MYYIQTVYKRTEYDLVEGLLESLRLARLNEYFEFMEYAWDQRKFVDIEMCANYPEDTAQIIGNAGMITELTREALIEKLSVLEK